MTIKKEKGFTLIEILIVVAIIAVLASIVIVGVGPAQQSGRDARRISDLQNVRNGLQLYYSKCGFYPGATSGSTLCPAQTNSYAGMTTALTGSNLGISSIPVDPSSNRNYYYAASADGSSYTLGAVLENPNNSVFNGYTAPTAVIPTSIPGGTCAYTTTQPNYCVSL
ncbi:MAG: type II secretion system protein [Candidatus Pacebacteria bacterium]|nr:type II secretion system protein [Candidatus Paceibacterota bacterium]